MDVGQIKEAYANFIVAHATDIALPQRVRVANAAQLSQEYPCEVIEVTGPELNDALFDKLMARAEAIGQKYPEYATAINTRVDFHSHSDCTIITAHYAVPALQKGHFKNSFDSLEAMWLRRWDFGQVVTFAQRTMNYGDPSFGPTDHVLVATSETFDARLFSTVRKAFTELQSKSEHGVVLTQMGVTFNGRSYRLEATYRERRPAI